jgi:putative flippase GtrA
MTNLSHPAFKRFLRYSIVGISTLSFDLLLLYALTHFLHIPYYFSTPFAFLVAVSINYVLSRYFVFVGTSRGVRLGYLYFAFLAVGGALLITGTVYLLVTYASLHFLVARILVAGFVGMGNYLLNLNFNFRVAGMH